MNARSRKRPFYRVSGEAYEYSIKLLRHFVPEDQLPELNVESIQSFLRQLDRASDTIPYLPAPAGELTVENEDTAVPVDTGGTNETMEVEEHPVLQEELGCMLLDSMGKYRMFPMAAHIALRVPCC